jgi:hypothetical protein
VGFGLRQVGWERHRRGHKHAALLSLQMCVFEAGHDWVDRIRIDAFDT